jgi:hypothetical protein
MWQNWVLLYIGVWIAVSGFVYAKPAKLHNLVFGAIIAIFAVWAGFRSRQLRKEGGKQ